MNGKQHVWFGFALTMLFWIIFDQGFGIILAIGLGFGMATSPDNDRYVVKSHRNKWFHSALYTFLFLLLPISVIGTFLRPVLETTFTYIPDNLTIGQWGINAPAIPTIRLVFNVFLSVAVYPSIAVGSHLILDIFRIGDKKITKNRQVVRVKNDVLWLLVNGLILLVPVIPIGIFLYF